MHINPWAFGFNALSDITRSEISFTGSKQPGIGLAFNNFSPIALSQLQLLLFSLGIMGLAARRFKK